MVLAHNLTAMNAQRQFNIVGMSKKKSTEKLSSGYKINRAADDAAGLTISEKMRSQIRGLHQASENCQDGVSYVQVADGALNEVQDMLHRMTELSVKAANGTNTGQDRMAINEELQQITSEIQRVFTETEFNTKRIWDEPEVEDSKKIQTGTENVVAISRDETFGAPMKITNTNIGAFPKSNDYISVSANTDGINFSWNALNGNKYSTSVIPWDMEIGGLHTIHIGDFLDKTAYPELEGIDFTYSYTVDERVTDLNDVKSLLDGDKLYANGNARAEWEFIDIDGNKSPVNSTKVQWFNIDMLYAGGANVEIDDHDFIVSPNNGQNVVNNPFLSGADSKLSFEIYNKNLGSLIVPTSDYPLALITVEGLYFTSSMTSFSDQVDDLVNQYKMSSSTKAADIVLPLSEAFYENDNDLNLKFTESIRVGLNKETSADYVKEQFARLGGYSVYLKANTAQLSLSAGDKKKKLDLPVYENIDYVKDAKKKNIDIMAGNRNSEASIINIEYDNLRLKSLGLENVNVLTDNEAKKLIGTIGKALEIVSSERSEFGAYQNRLEHTIANLDNIVENTQAAESRIRDTDMATEMVNNTKLNILEQAVTSMMAQANQSTQGVLSLLQ